MGYGLQLGCESTLHHVSWMLQKWRIGKNFLVRHHIKIPSIPRAIACNQSSYDYKLRTGWNSVIFVGLEVEFQIVVSAAPSVWFLFLFLSLPLRRCMTKQTKLMNSW